MKPRLATIGVALLLLGGGASTLVAGSAGERRAAKGTVVIARGSPLMVEEGDKLAFVSVTPAASLVGFERLIELSPGDSVSYEWSAEVAGVRQADILEVAPLVHTEAPFSFTEGELVTALRQGTAPVLFDVRAGKEYRRGHIEGAISLPAGSLSGKGTKSPSPLPGPVVVYGAGPRDGQAPFAARALLRAGFENVKVFQGGLAHWLGADNVVCVAVEHLVEVGVGGSDWVVVDVRPVEEGKGRRPAEAVSVPPEAFRWQDFDGRVPLRNLLLVGRDREDRSPWEMADRIRLLRSQRTTRTSLRIHILEGGFAAWRAAGLPVDVDESRSTTFRQGRVGPGEIGVEEFEELWVARGGEGAVFLDVRRNGASGEPWVVEIPLEQLPERIGELPKDREVIAFCTLGERSHVAAELLRANGYRARFLRAASPH